MSEISRTVRLDTLAAVPRQIEIEANAAERAALADRFGLAAIDALSADVAVLRNGDEVVARGRLQAEVVQYCAASGEPVPEKVDEEFAILFRPPVETSADEEIELSEKEMDVVFYDGGAIDLGEAIADTLSLSLNPFPRAPDADLLLKEAGVKTEEEAKPAGAFSGLKDLLGGKK